MIDWVKQRFLQFDQQLIAVNQNGSVTYAEFVERINYWQELLPGWGIKTGDRVGLISEDHINVVALLHALMEAGCIVIPLSVDDHSVFEERLDIAHATKLIRITNAENCNEQGVQCTDYKAKHTELHPLLESMLMQNKAGFVIYTSGTTGKSKAVLLEYERLIDKFKEKVRASFRTLLFLKLDHIGGLNTLLSVIFNGGVIVTCPSRQVKDICACIEKYAVELLPTTPSFLTMVLISGIYKDFDLSSLKLITYGTEVMPESTLRGIHKAFPDVKLKQTYGISELGIFSTRSKDSQSRWMKIDRKGVDLKVVDGVLWLRSDQAMWGYLNAESPFDVEGWYNSGDQVEVQGDYFRIQGRESEIINVAGEKVFPAEIESFLLTIDNVKDVAVRGKNSPITGKIIWADFALEKEEDLSEFKKKVIRECTNYFPAFKVPRLITISKQDNFVGSRFKKNRLLEQ